MCDVKGFSLCDLRLKMTNKGIECLREVRKNNNYEYNLGQLRALYDAIDDIDRLKGEETIEAKEG